MRIGYWRVSTRDRHLDARNALKAAGCRPIFVDTPPAGSSPVDRNWRKELELAGAGDQLVITELEPARTIFLEHLIALSRQLDAAGVDLAVLDRGMTRRSRSARLLLHPRSHRPVRARL